MFEESTLVYPFAIYELAYHISIKEFSYRSMIVFSGKSAIVFTGALIALFVACWIYSYYWMYSQYSRNLLKSIIYIIFNPYWILFYYLCNEYIEIRKQDDNYIVLILIVLGSVIFLKIFNTIYVKVLRK